MSPSKRIAAKRATTKSAPQKKKSAKKASKKARNALRAQTAELYGHRWKLDADGLIRFRAIYGYRPKGQRRDPAAAPTHDEARCVDCGTVLCVICHPDPATAWLGACGAK